MPPGCRRHTAAAATLPLRPHCRCHTAAAPSHRARQCHTRRCHARRPLLLLHPPPPRLPLPHPPLYRPPPPRRHRPAAPEPLHHCHRAARDTSPAAASPASETPHPLTVHPSPEAAGKWPEDTSNPPVHGQHTGTLGMVHPQLCSVAQHQSRIKQNPFKTNTTTIQQPHNNHTTTTQQPHNNRTTTVIDPKAQGRRRCHPSPHCATARRGSPEAYPKSRPHPQDPKGGAGTTPRHTAPRRGEGGRWPTRRAAPTVKKVTPRPLR